MMQGSINLAPVDGVSPDSLYKLSPTYLQVKHPVRVFDL